MISAPGALPTFGRKEAQSTIGSMGSFTITIGDLGGTIDESKSPVYSPTGSATSASSASLATPVDPSVSEPVTSDNYTNLATPTDPELLQPPSLSRPEPAHESPVRRSIETMRSRLPMS